MPSLVSLEKELHQRFCSYLDVWGCLSVAATCKAARDEWLPPTCPVWWSVLLRLAGLDGSGLAETTATAEFVTAKDALRRLAPLVLSRQRSLRGGVHAGSHEGSG